MRDMSFLDARLEEIRRKTGQIHQVYYWFDPQQSVDGRLVDTGACGVIAISRDLRAYHLALCDSREEAEAVARYAMDYFERHGGRHVEATGA